MPSSMFYNLDDYDLGALIAHLRTLPDKGTDTLPANAMRLLVRIGLATGKYNVEPRTIVHDAARPVNGPDPAARGEYIAKSTCTECHGRRLEGGDRAPALSIVAGYSPAEFGRLLRTGVPKDGRELTLMAEVAKSRFVHLTDEEVDALYSYLSQQLASSKR
jgi:mono/diheme cytochrome c family protein